MTKSTIRHSVSFEYLSSPLSFKSNLDQGYSISWLVTHHAYLFMIKVGFHHLFIMESPYPLYHRFELRQHQRLSVLHALLLQICCMILLMTNPRSNISILQWMILAPFDFIHSEHCISVSSYIS
jgi:hypothetical protein